MTNVIFFTVKITDGTIKYGGSAMTISEKIYKLRTDLGLSQKEFADQVGTSQSAINYWENGKREPRNNQLKKIAEKYSIPLYILTDDNFDLWNINDPPNKKRARLVGYTKTEKTPLFTIPTTNERPLKNNSSTIKILDENYFKRITQKEERGQNLTQEEKEYKYFFLSESITGIGIKFAEYYFMLNEKGQKKADAEINRTLEFLMLISQVPEYRRGED